MTRRGHVSIRARLLVVLLSVTALVWVAVVVRSRSDARRELNRLFDAQLAQSAKILLAQASHDVRELRDAERARKRFEHAREHPYEQRLHFQIRDRQGRLLYRSSSDVPDEPLGGARDGYSDQTLHGVRWRVFVLTDPDAALQIEICQRYDVRERLTDAVARNMMLPLVVALPLLAALIWIATRQAIRPLSRVEREFTERAPDDLRPFADRQAPRELIPLIDALNGLLARLQERFEVERRFTADAAHELRTPLAALRTQTQVALAARNGAEREHALRQVLRGIDRATHLVAQLLTLARVDPDHAEVAAEPVDLQRVAAAVAAELAPPALEKGIDISVEAEPDLRVDGNAALLGTLLRNLVENAVRSCGAGDVVRVSANRAAGAIVLEVVDSGPGIPEAERDRVFDRFHRVLRGGDSGSGLGLSIVKRIADLHHATIALSAGDGGRGLRATVRFPGDLRHPSR